MSLVKLMAALICLTLSAICFIPGCAAFQDTISVIETKNISFNLVSESEYNISKNASVAMLVQTISINSTEPKGKNASVMLMSINMEGDDSQQINQTEFSSFMENLFLGAVKLTSGAEVSSTLVNSPQGKNVTLHTIAMQTGKNMPPTESIMAFWDLDEYTHAILTSELDLNTTAMIAETMKITP